MLRVSSGSHVYPVEQVTLPVTDPEHILKHCNIKRPTWAKAKTQNILHTVFFMNQHKYYLPQSVVCAYFHAYTVFVCVVEVCVFSRGASPTWFLLSIWRSEPSRLADSITPLLRSHQYRRWDRWSRARPLGDTRPVLTTTSRTSLFRPERSTAGRLPMSVQYTFLQTHRREVTAC